MPSGVTETHTVSAVAGAIISVASPGFSVAPEAESAWVVESASLAAQTFRVISVLEDGQGPDLSFAITALAHNASKFANIDTGAPLSIPPVTAITPSTQPGPTTVTITSVPTAGQVIASTLLNVQWDAVPSAVQYVVEYQKDYGTWQSMGKQKALSADITNVTAGTYIARVQAVNASNIASQPTESASYTVSDQTLTPGFADDLSIDVAQVRADFEEVADQADELRDDVDAAIAQVQVLQAQVGDILQADAWDVDTTYPLGDLVQASGKLYRSLQDDNTGHEPAGATDAWWEYIGNYASLGEAVSATAANVAVNNNKITQTQDNLTALSETVTENAADIATKASASALTATNATVAQQGNVITASAADIALLGAHNAGKTAFNLNSNTVKIDGGQTLAQTLTGLQVADGALGARVDGEQSARIAGDEANANAILAVQASLASKSNLVSKPYFDDGSAGSWSGAPTVVNTGDSSMAPHSVLKVTASSYDVAGQFPATSGETFDVSVICSMFYATGTGSGLPRIQWFDSAGATLAYSNGSQFARGAGGVKRSFVATAPAGAATGRFGFAFSDSNAGYAYLLAPTVERRSSGLEQTSSVVQQLTANVGPGGAYAQATTMLDVNGRITGVRQTNDGSTGDFIILADKFAIVSPSGGAHTEYSDGSWRVYSDSSSVEVVRLGKLS